MRPRDEITIAGVTYLHPSRVTDAQRRENTAGILERFACAHETLAARGEQPDHQRAMAASARRAAVRGRRPHNPTAER